MLKIEEIEGQDAVYVVSDDGNAENANLSDAVELAAPHLVDEFNGTPVENGLLKWRVPHAEYDSLLEVFDALEGCDPNEVDAASTLIEKKQKGVI